MMRAADRAPIRRTLVHLTWVLVMAFFFAKVEVQIKGLERGQVHLGSLADSVFAL